MSAPGTTTRARFLAAVLTAIAGSVEASVAPELGGKDAADDLERAVSAAREKRAGIEAVKRAGHEAWRIHQQRGGSQ